MNPPRKTTGLFLTPRTPYGRRLTDRAQHHHMRASEDRTPRAVGQEAMDQFKRQADLAGNMAASNVPGSLKPTGEIPGAGQTDKNGVPPGLQSRISPQRAGEITDPSRQPLPSPKIPRMTNQMFPLDPKQQPLPAQSSQTSNGAGDLVHTQTHEQLPLSPGNASKSMEKQKPKSNWPQNPLNFDGVIVTPSVNQHGGAVQIQVPWEKIFNRK